MSVLYYFILIFIFSPNQKLHGNQFSDEQLLFDSLIEENMNEIANMLVNAIEAVRSSNWRSFANVIVYSPFRRFAMTK